MRGKICWTFENTKREEKNKQTNEEKRERIVGKEGGGG
jgi:hypothetical protein